MKGEIKILKNRQEMSLLDRICEPGISEYDFCLELYVDDNDSLVNQLSKKKDIIKDIKNYINNYNEMFKFQISKKVLESADKIIENIDNLIDYVEFIEIDTEEFDIVEFIDNNPIIRDKKIVISEMLDIKDYDKLKELSIKYRNYKNNIYVLLKRNSRYVSLNDCCNTILSIKNQGDKILGLNLSPMETVMYTYDQVRNRVYKKEKNGDLPSKSRDLTSILNNEEIVCVGYTNYLDALLTYMGFKSEAEELKTGKEDEPGHYRNVIYIKDDKYDIDGVYYLDATWDSKKENETNEYLNRYKYFARTRQEMELLESNKYLYKKCPYYSENMVSDIKQVLKNDDLEKLKVKYLSSLNFLSNLIEDNQLIGVLDLIPTAPLYNSFDRRGLLKRLDNIASKFNKVITKNNFLKLLINVRKIEYYENPNLYPYEISYLQEAYMSFCSGFIEYCSNEEEIRLNRIFGVECEVIKNYKKCFKKYMISEEVDKSIKRVQLAKTLQKVYQKKIK